MVSPLALLWGSGQLLLCAHIKLKRIIPAVSSQFRQRSRLKTETSMRASRTTLVTFRSLIALLTFLAMESHALGRGPMYGQVLDRTEDLSVRWQLTLRAQARFTPRHSTEFPRAQ